MLYLSAQATGAYFIPSCIQSITQDRCQAVLYAGRVQDMSMGPLFFVRYVGARMMRAPGRMGKTVHSATHQATLIVVQCNTNQDDWN